MKVFISRPMRGKTKDDFYREKIRVYRLIAKQFPAEAERNHILDTYIDEDYEENHPGLKYLAKSLELLDEADLVFFAKGFRKARGCLIEYEAAKNYGISDIIIEEEDF